MEESQKPRSVSSLLPSRAFEGARSVAMIHRNVKDHWSFLVMHPRAVSSSLRVRDGFVVERFGLCVWAPIVFGLGLQSVPQFRWHG